MKKKKFGGENGEKSRLNRATPQGAGDVYPVGVRNRWVAGGWATQRGVSGGEPLGKNPAYWGVFPQ